MKFAREVIDLMAPFPGRVFRMQQLVRYVTAGNPPNPQATTAARKAVSRVLIQLEASRHIVIKKANSRGSPAHYIWL